MEYKYHCQYQAESFADSILPVPENYPLRDGLPEDFRTHFARLCELAKNIYLDIAKQPENYGLMLVDIESSDHNLARDGYRTIHRFVDTLSNLSRCGELKNHQLIISAEKFREAVKKGHGAVSNPVPKYELILSRLIDFGFAISDFEGKPFSKKVESFTVEYPGCPEMIDAIKIYCGCWDELKSERSAIKLWPKEFHHHYYRFDYKITADCDGIPMRQWISDEADYLGYPAELKDFSLAFHEYSLKYKGVNFDGDYTYKSKRIARIIRTGYIALSMGESVFCLSLKLKNMDRYMAEINSMPDSIKSHMSRDNCRFCDFQGATPEQCKYRVYWTLDGISHVGCAHACFDGFNDFDLARVPDYWRLLELEYGLEKA